MAAAITTDVFTKYKLEGTNKAFRVVDFTPPTTNYPAGGYPITPSDCQLSTIDMLIPVPSTVASDLTYTYNPSTGKLVAQVISTAAESGAADQSAKTARFLVFGTEE